MYVFFLYIYVHIYTYHYCHHPHIFICIFVIATPPALSRSRGCAGIGFSMSAVRLQPVLLRRARITWKNPGEVLGFYGDMTIQWDWTGSRTWVMVNIEATTVITVLRILVNSLDKLVLVNGWLLVIIIVSNHGWNSGAVPFPPPCQWCPRRAWHVEPPSLCDHQPAQGRPRAMMLPKPSFEVDIQIQIHKYGVYTVYIYIPYDTLYNVYILYIYNYIYINIHMFSCSKKTITQQSLLQSFITSPPVTSWIRSHIDYKYIMIYPPCNKFRIVWSLYS